MFCANSVLYVGTRCLGARCLEYLVENIGAERFAGVLTIPRGEQGWWSYEGYREVWEVAEEKGIPLVNADELKTISYDLLLSILWEKIFSAEIIEKATLGAINLHPAPLPKYRGSLTRTHAIANGERSYGVSMHYMVPNVDQGDIISVSEFPILDNDTASSLDLRTMAYGYPLFCETWQRLCDGSARRISQKTILESNGEVPVTYTMASLESLLANSSRELTLSERDRLTRALYFPPKITPPSWLLEPKSK